MLNLLLTAGLALLPSGSPNYGVISHFAVGGEGGWDYLTDDPASHRLFVSRGSHVMVVDTENGSAVGDIPDTPGVHGIAIANRIGRGFTSNGREGTVSVFDLKSLKVLGKIRVGQNPDGILYDPISNKLVTCNGRSQDLSIIDPMSNAVLGTVKLTGKPETPASDGHTLFINIEDKSTIERVDLESMKSLGVWSIAPVEEPSGLAFDRAHHHLFAVGSNKLMAVVDSLTGKVVATPAIGDEPDAAGFDPRRGLVFSSNGEGSLTIVAASGGFKVLQTVTTQPSARTMALDTKTGRVYLSAAQRQPGEGRQPMVAGSFTIVVVGAK